MNKTCETCSRFHHGGECFLKKTSVKPDETCDKWNPSIVYVIDEMLAEKGGYAEWLRQKNKKS